MSEGPERLLDDESMARYLRDGFIVLEADELPPSFHEEMFAAACSVHDEGRAIAGDSVHLQTIGDNLRARIPGLQRLLHCPTVRGALTSVLGEGFVLHPHHFVHEASTNDQSFHQDGNLPWNERAHYRTHRPNWAMLFYYPQAVTEASGPTEVLPGTQYWTTDFELEDGTWHRGDAADKTLRPGELSNPDLGARDRRIRHVVDLLGVDGLERRRLTLDAGSLVLANYDLFHRGTRAAQGRDSRRFMYKFYYLRTREPDAPSWRNVVERPPACAGVSRAADAVVETIWHWLRGDRHWRPAVENTGQIDRIGLAEAEDERVRLAYEIGWLAREDRELLARLGELLTSPREAVRRAAGYAMGIAGGGAAAQVARALEHADAPIRRAAALAAGEGRLDADAVVAALFARLETDPDDLVRSNAAYSLANIARVAPEKVPARRLLARLEDGVETDNSANGGMRRSTVRESVAYALNNLSLDADDLECLARRGLGDHDRYVQGLTITALERHVDRGGAWLPQFVDHLVASRFNPRPPRPPAPGG